MNVQGVTAVLDLMIRLSNVQMRAQELLQRAQMEGRDVTAEELRSLRQDNDALMQQILDDDPE